MTGPDALWRQYLVEGRFMLQRSPSSAFVFPPRIAAPATGEPLEWVEASGRGTVYSTTVVRAKPPAEPYNVALIDLAENVRMMSRVDGVAPDAVTIGLSVHAAIIEEEGRTLLVFRPAA